MALLKEQTDKLTKFSLPCSLQTSDLVLLDQFEFSSELAKYAKRTLTKGLAKDHAKLNQVAEYVGTKLAAKDGGNWVCVIEPFDVETGWMLKHTDKGQVLTFKIANLKYIVFLYRLKVTE